MPTAVLLTRLATISLIIGSIGFSMIGLITKDDPTKPIHDTMSSMAFGGLGGGIFFMFLVSVRKLILKETSPTLLQFFIVYGIIFGMGLAVVLIKNVHIQQWTGMFTVLVYLVTSFLISPKEKQI
jgi:hypothetical protein